MPRARRVAVERFPSSRRLVIAGFRAGRRRVPMYGLLDLDVTTAKRLLESADPPLSMTAFVIASVARAAAAHPTVHAYRNWRGKQVTHHFVDVATMVEVPTRQGPFALPYTLRDADTRTVADLSAELHRDKHSPTSTRTGRFWIEGLGPPLTRLPGAVPALYAIMSRSIAIRRRVGTVGVTAVGMFASGSGFGLTPLTLMSCEVIVGGMSQRPRVVDGKAQTRDVLDLTLVIDHTIVDGAPAARFGADLRELIETAAALTEAT
ncbi:MAG TPA: 2-oxo acid dehydrogenase subunit E2 [Jatrophihabitans sp.]|nr:2-oxo acid dehydrogenase subunit E2 [Jatrophihabitans sp.]